MIAYLIPSLLPTALPKFPKLIPSIDKEIGMYLPVLEATGKYNEDSNFVILKKPKGATPLRDLVSSINHDLDHVSWIISSLYNFLCYLELVELTHNAITMDNVFVNHETHQAFLVGGWGYSAFLDTPLSYLPKDVLSLAPSLAKTKIASPIFDLTAIKRLGLDLLGGPMSTHPFLRSPSLGSAIADYKAWQAQLGPRKFTKLELKQ